MIEHGQRAEKMFSQRAFHSESTSMCCPSIIFSLIPSLSVLKCSRGDPPKSPVCKRPASPLHWHQHTNCASHACLSYGNSLRLRSALPLCPHAAQCLPSWGQPICLRFTRSCSPIPAAARIQRCTLLGLQSMQSFKYSKQSAG